MSVWTLVPFTALSNINKTHHLLSDSVFKILDSIDFTKSQKELILMYLNKQKLSDWGFTISEDFDNIYIFNLPKKGKWWKPVLYSKLNSKFYTWEVNPYVYAN